MIFGFAQLRNELQNGNLLRFADNMNSLTDTVYVYDQDSTDMSYSVYCENLWEVFYSSENKFSQEIRCKQVLLDMIKEDYKDGWILWLDGDSILNTTRSSLDQIIYHCECEGYDSVAFGHLNLWSNERTYRVDNNYIHLDDIGVIALWKISDDLRFSEENGLHKLQYPSTLRSTFDAREIKIHHYGFISEEKRKAKYDLYKSLGQSGYDLDRILDVATLRLEEV